MTDTANTLSSRTSDTIPVSQREYTASLRHVFSQPDFFGEQWSVTNDIVGLLDCASRPSVETCVRFVNHARGLAISVNEKQLTPRALANALSLGATMMSRYLPETQVSALEQSDRTKHFVGVVASVVSWHIEPEQRSAFSQALKQVVPEQN